MNKKGFTLVELLAIIIVLEIISLITVPVISNNLEKARQKSALANIESFIDILQKHISETIIDDNNAFEDGVYTINEIVNTNIEANGKIPTDGWAIIKKGKVVSYSFKTGDYVINKLDSDVTITKTDTVSAIPSNKAYYKGDKISFNAGDGTIRDWYVIKDSNYLSTEVNLILANDYKTNLTYSNALTSLPTTTVWRNASNIRLLTEDDLNDIFGILAYTTDNKYNLASDDLSSSSTIVSKGNGKYKWLYNNTENCISNGCDTSGSTKYYWTNITTTQLAFTISNGLLLPMDKTSTASLRPVITVNKSILQN